MSGRYDLVIAGGGMVGAALACALAGCGLRIAVVEARPPRRQWPEDSIDQRVSAISVASERIFRGLGAWEAMVARGVSPFLEMRVWDAGGSGAIHFDSADLGVARLGHIIENRVIQTALLERLEAGGVELICPAVIERFRRGTEGLRLYLEDGAELRTALLVGADGAASRVRELAGIGTRGWSYEQQAVVAWVRTRQSHEHTAWQRFLPEGPLAFLPLRDGRSSIVWSTTPARAEALLAMDETDFCAALGEAFEHRLGQVLEAGPRAAFPLRLQHARRYVGERLVLVGDAAHTIHPLAGQGVNLGLLDAAALAEVIRDRLQRGRDFAATAALRRYERWRKGDNLLTMAVMDGFQRLFGTDFPPLRLARNAGLTAVDRAQPLKNLFMRHAMGLHDDLPRLARGPLVECG